MILFIFLILILILYALFSYILTEPNLILSSNPLYWNFQLKMWERFYHDSQFITAAFVFLVLALFFCYIWILSLLKNRKDAFDFSSKSIYLWLYGAIILPLFLSYNALSHDIFNYIFNARMVLKWGYNPHIKAAIDFAPIDDWVRFMHNIHTTAPYGYGWTVISLLPSFLGMEKLLPTLIMFRLFMIGSIILLYFAIQHMSQTIYKRKLYLYELAMVFLNPLFLIEVISNYHNDLWMMAPAILATSMVLRLLQPSLNKKNVRFKVFYFIVSLLFLGLSISIKLVTLILMPLFVFVLLLLFFLPKYSAAIQRRFKLPIPKYIISTILLFLTSKIEKYIPSILAIILFIPLFSQRSQQFLPWYLLWILVWLPFIKNKTLRNVIIIFSFSSMLRYVPWLKNGFEYNDAVQLKSRLITWVLPVVYLVTNLKNNIKNLKYLGKSNL